MLRSPCQGPLVQLEHFKYTHLLFNSILGANALKIQGRYKVNYHIMNIKLGHYGKKKVFMSYYEIRSF